MGAGIGSSAGGAATQEIPLREPTVISSPNLSKWWLAVMTVVVTILLAFCTTFAVDSIDGLTQKTVLSQSFIGLVLLPLLGCNVHAITLARKDQMPQSFEITINSSIQLLLGILPLAVLVDWARNDSSMTLLFNGFQVVSLAVSILILRYIIGAGKTHW